MSVALMALANFSGLPSLLFTLLLISIAADFHAEGQDSPIVDIDQATDNQSCLRLSTLRCSSYIQSIGDGSVIPVPRRGGDYG